MNTALLAFSLSFFACALIGAFTVGRAVARLVERALAARARRARLSGPTTDEDLDGIRSYVSTGRDVWGVER